MTMKKKWRTIQPAHESDKFTVEEAMEAWRKVEERAKQSRRSRTGAGHPKETSIPKASSPARSKVAADRDAAP
jgi:hypothetical protein